MPSIYFKVLNEGYVQNGNYEVKKSYVAGQHFQQGLGQVMGADKQVLPFPDNFSREYNTFVTYPDPATVDPETVTDRAFYNTAERAFISEIKVPKFKRVTFMYMYDTNGVRPSSQLVEFEGSLTALQAMYPDLAAGKMYSYDEYYETFTGEGFNRYGKVLPKHIHRSCVDELRVIGGLIVDSAATVDNNGVSPAAGTPVSVNLYVSPLWLNNAQPTFSEAYIHGEADFFAAKDFNSDVSLLPGRLVRWLAGSNEGNSAFMNFTDHNAGVDLGARFGSNYTGTTRVDINPAEPETGEELKNSYQYNLTNTLK